MNPSAKCNSFKVGEWKTGLLSTGTGLSLRGLGLFSGSRLQVGFGIRFAGRVRIAEEKKTWKETQPAKALNSSTVSLRCRMLLKV